MKKIISIFAFATLFLMGGCNDEAFLKEEPKYFYTLDNAFTTRSQVEQALVGCYARVRNIQFMATEGNPAFVLRGGNGTDMYDVPSIRHNNQFNDYSQLNPERNEYKTIFADWYSLISAANFALYGIRSDVIVWDSDEQKAYASAQARFFRAWAYRNLAEEFGGVPIVTEFCTEARFDFARASREDTYQFAIEELEAILPDLPLTSGEKGRIVRGAAHHTLSQLYLDKGIALEEEGRADEALQAYRSSVSYADELIEGTVYKLMTSRFGTRKNENPKFYYASNDESKTEAHTYTSAGVNIVGNVFWDLFQTGNQSYQEGNRESVWIVRAELDSYIEEDSASRLSYSRSFGPVFRDPQAGIIQGTMEDVGGRGVCWVMPTEYARDLVYAGAFADDMRNSESVLRRKIVGNVPGSQYYGKVVPWNVIYKDGASSSVRQAAYTQCYPISCKIHSDFYPDDSAGGNKSNLYRDDYVIRLAETYLVRAEAKLRSGDKTGAAADVNALRNRAKCSYLYGASEMTLETILDERARELLYEEIRWNTLLRMGGTVAVDRIRKYSYWEYPRSGSMKNFNVWPIPQSVIDTNKDAIIEQNEGWK